MKILPNGLNTAFSEIGSLVDAYIGSLVDAYIT